MVFRPMRHFDPGIYEREKFQVDLYDDEDCESGLNEPLPPKTGPGVGVRHRTSTIDRVLTIYDPRYLGSMLYLAFCIYVYYYILCPLYVVSNPSIHHYLQYLTRCCLILHQNTQYLAPPSYQPRYLGSVSITYTYTDIKPLYLVLLSCLSLFYILYLVYAVHFHPLTPSRLLYLVYAYVHTTPSCVGTISCTLCIYYHYILSHFTPPASRPYTAQTWAYTAQLTAYRRQRRPYFSPTRAAFSRCFRSACKSALADPFSCNLAHFTISCTLHPASTTISCGFKQGDEFVHFAQISQPQYLVL